MEKYIDKFALVAEIKRRRESNAKERYFGRLVEDNYFLDFLDTLEVKEVDNEEYWLVSVRYVLNGGNAGSNCFFSYFPTKQDIQNTIGVEEYTILHIQKLTEEQFNKLTGREHGTED